MEKFQELDYEELYDIDGGIAWVPVLIAGGVVASALLGVYNGYHDTKDQKR